MELLLYGVAVVVVDAEVPLYGVEATTTTMGMTEKKDLIG